MSTISVRIPESLHKAVRDLAQRDNVSINQYIAIALAEKVSAMMTETYLQERAERASRDKFEAALAAVPDTPPDEQDGL